MSPEVQDLAEPQSLGGVCVSASPSRSNSFATLNWEFPDAPWAVRFNNQTNTKHHVTTMKNISQGRDTLGRPFFFFLPFPFRCRIQIIKSSFHCEESFKAKELQPRFSGTDLDVHHISPQHRLKKKKLLTHFLFLIFIRVLNTVSHSMYMAQQKHQRNLSVSMGYFAFPLMKCSNTRQAASISLQSKQSPKKEIFMMKEPKTSSVLMKMSNCRHRVNYFCSQP